MSEAHDLADSEFRSWADSAKADIDRLRFHLSGYKNEAERLRGVIDRAYYAIPAGDYHPTTTERVLMEFMDEHAWTPPKETTG